MPIRSLLSETRFRPDQTEVIVKAFDDAWDQLRGEQSDPVMEPLLRTALAKRILETAQQADIDARKLRDDAIGHIRNSHLWPDPRPVGADRVREINEGDSERQ
jgi:hypothetical protein